MLKIGAALLGGIALVLLCNADRGVLVPIEGVPYVVLLVLAVLAVWTFLLGRTKIGRYMYAIGGNAEAARRAGISLSGIRILAFMLCSLTAGHRRHRLRLAAAVDLDRASMVARSCSTRSPPP